MKTRTMNILLADDDADDCSFFAEALEKISLDTSLHVVHDGEQLMSYLQMESTVLPDVLFLDLNMHRKNGFECLEEIKNNLSLKRLPVIVFSTSFDQERVDLLYKSGAHYFMRKPAIFSQLMALILQALNFLQRDLETSEKVSEANVVISQPDKSQFILI